jgi:hypothetical protein
MAMMRIAARNHPIWSTRRLDFIRDLEAAGGSAVGRSISSSSRLIRRPLHGRDKAIAEPGKGFDKSRILCRVFQRLAQFPHRSVQAVLKVDKCVFWPQSGPKLIAAYDLSVGNQKETKHSEGLCLDGNIQARSLQFARVQIDVESIEPRFRTGNDVVLAHSKPQRTARIIRKRRRRQRGRSLPDYNSNKTKWLNRISSVHLQFTFGLLNLAELPLVSAYRIARLSNASPFPEENL